MCLKFLLYVIFCVACDIMFVQFFISVKNVGTHGINVKFVGTVELNAQPTQTHGGQISSTTTWPRRT
jgi:hypothetical protein